MPLAFVAPLGAHRPATFIGLRPSVCRLPTRAARAPTRLSPLPVAAPVRASPCAKLFDWKKRQDPNHAAIPEEDEGIFKLTNIRAAPGSRQKKKRKGRGDAAGQGAKCGFGMRGQKSRSGRGVRAGFEGGQTPLYRRIPKFVGRPMGPGHKKKEFALMKIDHLNGCEEGSVVTFEALKERGIMTKQKRKIIKVVGGTGLLVGGLTVRAHAFTKSAIGEIEGKGGKCIRISRTTGKDLAEGEDTFKGNRFKKSTKKAKAKVETEVEAVDEAKEDEVSESAEE